MHSGLAADVSVGSKVPFWSAQAMSLMPSWATEKADIRSMSGGLVHENLL
jgi:hypothetical protein